MREMKCSRLLSLKIPTGALKSPSAVEQMEEKYESNIGSLSEPDIALVSEEVRS